MAILYDVRQDPSLLKKKAKLPAYNSSLKKRRPFWFRMYREWVGWGGWAFGHMSICLINSFLSASLVASKGLGIEVFAY